MDHGMTPPLRYLQITRAGVFGKLRGESSSNTRNKSTAYNNLELYQDFRLKDPEEQTYHILEQIIAHKSQVNAEDGIGFKSSTHHDSNSKASISRTWPQMRTRSHFA
ncbi:hypothetical protein VTN96DRAFT_1838 [Rasamsonia emersonii]